MAAQLQLGSAPHLDSLPPLRLTVLLEAVFGQSMFLHSILGTCLDEIRKILIAVDHVRCLISKRDIGRFKVWLGGGKKEK